MGRNSLELDDLKKHRSVHLISAETGLQIKRWAVYQCLYCELDWHCHHFLLTNGTWYEIQPEFMKVVNDSVKDLVKATSLPPYSDTSEEAYNIRTSQEILGLALMDQDLIRYAGAAGPIEFCDLYSASKEIIHVKRYGASSTLSHLFSQGLVSGTLFARDADFRSHVNAKLPATHKLASSDDHLRAGEYTVVFAVVSQSQKPLQLPFFSRVNLRNAARQLQGLGFKVQLVKINASARKPRLTKWLDGYSRPRLPHLVAQQLRVGRACKVVGRSR